MAVATLNLQRFVSTSDEFYELCQENPDLNLERTANGEVLIMAPAGSETGARNLSIGSQLYSWNEQLELGIAFGSSAGFNLPNGADRSPDASWIERSGGHNFLLKKKVSLRHFAPILLLNCAPFQIQ